MARGRPLKKLNLTEVERLELQVLQSALVRCHGCLVYCSQSDLTVSTHPPFEEVLIRPSLLARRQVRTTWVLAKSKTIADKEVDSTCLLLTFCAASAIVCLRQVRTSPRYSRRDKRSCSGFCCQPSLLGPPLMRNPPAGFA